LIVLSAKNGVCAKIGLAPNAEMQRITAVKIVFMMSPGVDALATR
jgi:hypothetical protein